MKIFEDNVITSVPLYFFKKDIDLLMLAAWGGAVVKVELGDGEEDEVYVISRELFFRLNLKIKSMNQGLQADEAEFVKLLKKQKYLNEQQ